MANWTLIILMVVFIISILVATKFVQRWQRQKITQMGFCPPEILSQFDKAEKMFKESNGERDPHSILWEIANEERLNRMKGGNNGKESNSTTEGTTKAAGTAYTGTNTASIVPTESRIESTNSDGESEGRQSFQNGFDAGNIVNNRSDKPIAPNYKGNFFSRFRRRNA